MCVSDVVLDLSYGDCGKGKVTYNLAASPEYDVVVRFAGGQNAGHTVYHNDEKFITHIVPLGVFFKKPSIIGPGCVFNVKKLFEEINELESKGVDVCTYLKIAYNAHIVTDEHLKEDSTDIRIGTTRTGTGPAYTSKFARTGLRAESVKALKKYLVDTVDYLNQPGLKVLFEGAQGYGLDIDHGDYPYVTSSSTTIAGVLTAGVPAQSVRKVYGVAKMYDTYVGAKTFQPKDEIFDLLRELGKEYGATTGRPRQCNWLNWDSLMKAVKVNGVTDVIFNKVDVLETLGIYNIIIGGFVVPFNNIDEMKNWIRLALPDNIRTVFSSSPVVI